MNSEFNSQILNSRPTHNARTWVEVDLQALEDNVNAIRSALPVDTRYISVIKGNAYGHGFSIVAKRLLRAGVTIFAVATVEELTILRSLAPHAEILFLTPVMPHEMADIISARGIPTVSSIGDVEFYQNAAQSLGQILQVQLKIDTGMNRLGCAPAEASLIAQKILSSPSLYLKGVFSHLASGTDALFTSTQREAFKTAVLSLPVKPELIHIDASDGFESFEHDSIFNAVRIGRLQYGIEPFNRAIKSRVSVRPVLSFHARIAYVKDAPAGATVSYGRLFTLQRPSRLGIIYAGYLDGISTRFTNKGAMIIGGELAPIVGRVTMDMTIVDLTDIPNIKAGDVATIIGTQGKSSINLLDYAQSVQMIAWEALNSINPRVTRIPVEKSLSQISAQDFLQSSSQVNSSAHSPTLAAPDHPAHSAALPHEALAGDSKVYLSAPARNR